MILVPSRGFDWKPFGSVDLSNDPYKDFSPLAGI